MGSSSSGRHGGRPTIEGCGSYRLSTKNLRQALRHPPGTDLVFRYRVDDEPMDVWLQVRPAQGCLRLRHPSREIREFSSDPPAEMEYAIDLTWTPAGFGGRRWWFLCPLSGRRCAVLHLPRGGRRFASARGYGLARHVTRLPEHERLWWKMAKIARRLGARADPEIPPGKPKGMHRRTYERLLAAWMEAAERRDRIYDTKIAGFLARGATLFG
jgi:hypothetical protein